MRFRRALMAFGLAMATAAATATPQASQGQPARVVDLAYEISFIGLPGFRMDVTARLDGQSYDIASHTFKEGLIRAFTIHYEGRNRAWGMLTPQGAVPRSGSLSIVVGDKPRTWRAEYGADGSVTETHSPEWKPPPQHQITDAQRRGSLDPLSAAMFPGFSSAGPCDRRLQSFDGKRRIDIVVRKVGTDTAAATQAPGAHGEAIVCEIHTERVAGEFHDAPKEAETEKQRPMRVWFVRLDESPTYYPVRLEAQTGFGTIRGKTLSFRQRPMTDSDREAMRR